MKIKIHPGPCHYPGALVGRDGLIFLDFAPDLIHSDNLFLYQQTTQCNLLLFKGSQFIILHGNGVISVKTLKNVIVAVVMTVLCIEPVHL